MQTAINGLLSVSYTHLLITTGDISYILHAEAMCKCVLFFLFHAYTAVFHFPDVYKRQGIAFDSGGVASGPMTATFLLPFAMGACEQLGGNVLLDAFGIVAMVAMTPLLTIQILGLVMTKHKKLSLIHI